MNCKDAPDPASVLDKLEKNRNGDPLPTIENFRRIFAFDPAFSGIRFNIVRQKPEKANGQPWSDPDDAWARLHIEQAYKLVNRAKCLDGFSVFLREREFDPIQEVINGIVWDGQERVEQFLS